MATEDPFEDWNDSRVFGAGIKRKRVTFVPATGDDVSPAKQRAPKASLAEKYLSITLGERSATAAPSVETEPANDNACSSTNESTPAAPPLCEICKAPIVPSSSSSPTLSSHAVSTSTSHSHSRSHDSSIAHQTCLQHSYPPSHLDRTRRGLKYLASYGWDPDARLGLGVVGEGIRAPLRGRVKNDKFGLGVRVKLDRRKRGDGAGAAAVATRAGGGGAKEGVKLLDAKAVRMKEAEEKRRAARLHGMFYGNGEVEKYLGEG